MRQVHFLKLFVLIVSNFEFRISTTSRNRALICKIYLFLKNFDKISNDDIFVESCIFCKQILFSTSIVLINVKDCIDVVFCMTKKNHEISCCVRNFRWSFAHFMFYFSIICYEIHVKLIHINARWIETIIYRVVNWIEIFVAHFRFMFACLLKYEKMSLTHANWFLYTLFERNVLQLICISFSTCALHLKIYRNFDEMFATLYIFRNSIVVCAKIWQNVEFDSRIFRNLIFFICLNSNEMFF